ncbi:MAG: Ig-like domain-containing protein [Fuerstiella sp.]|nr:tandem-95 repeat protein [Fuerstiella sp.]
MKGNVDQENTWHHETITIDGNNQVNNFNIRFRSKVSSSREDGFFDNVKIMGTLGATNEAPVANNDSGYNVSEDNTLTVTGSGVLANYSDADGDPLTAVSVSGPANGSLTLNADGSFDYTPDANFNGSDSFTYVANDGSADSNTATVSINVTSIDDVPQAADDSYNVAEDGILNVTGLGVLTNDIDADGDSLSATLVSGTTNGLLTLNSNGSFSYTPAAKFHGSDSFTYEVSDGRGDTTQATAVITVTSVNDGPVATGEAFSHDEDNTLNITAAGVLLNDSDADGDTLSAVLVSGAANGSVTLYADGSFDYTPDDDFYGTDSFSYVANDGTSDSNLATVSIMVDPVNDAPVAANDNLVTNEDTVLLINASSLLSNDNDVDLDSLAISSVSQPSHGTLTDNGNGTYTYSPTLNDYGPDSFGYTISDGNGGTDSATVSITVTPVNDTPTTSGISDVTVDEDSSPTDVNLFTAFSDIEDLDGDLVLSITGNTNSGLFTSTSIAAGVLSLNYAANANGSSDITVRATDTGGLFVESTFGVTVNPVNDAPVADSQSVMVKQETSRSITLTGSDIDGDALSFSIVVSPTSGTLTGTGATRTYSPDTGFTGSDSFSFIANDGTDDSATVSVTINVAANNIPVADAQSVNVNEDGSVSITLTGSDPDLDAITYSLTSDVSNGNLSGTAPNLTYTPDPNYNGSDEFTFIVNDGTDDSPAATVSINVAPVNDIPVAVPQSVTTDEDSPTAVTVSRLR